MILAVRYAGNPPADRFYVKIAYGTSKLKIGQRPDDFILANVATLDLIRLPQATRFDLDRVLWLPWAKPFFCPRRMDDRFSTPTMSVLPEPVKKLLEWTLATRVVKGLDAPGGPKSKA